MQRQTTQQGFGLLELIIALSILAVSGVAVMTAFAFYLKAGSANTSRVQALYLLDEGLEAARFIRDDDFASFSALDRNVPYYIATTTTGWEATTTPTTFLSVFTVTMTVRDVYRHTINQDILSASSTDPKQVDPSTIQTDIAVSWDKGTKVRSGEMNATTYFSDLFTEQ